MWIGYGENCVINMIIELHRIAEECIKEMQVNTELEMSERDQYSFDNAKRCHICCKKFNSSDIKVRDHDHRTGKYRGAAHNKCNINYFSNRFLPVVMHNLKGYDSHLIIKSAYDALPEIGNPEISAIPVSLEKFMSVTIGNIRFIDSLQFMSSSLSELVKNLYDKNDKYKNFMNMKKFYKSSMNLLCKKGHYPYEWVDSIEKLDYVGLPPKEAFYSSLSQEGISDEDYSDAKDVYNTLGCKSFRDYHEAYLKTDVLLLADVFENFRNTCMEYYDLDPANYYTAPGLAWDAMLLKTNIELELITDPTIFDMIERQKQGGLCFVGSKRHVTANNKYMDDYDKSKPSNYLMYWDANNLYGWAMSQRLPYKDLELIPCNEYSLYNILNTPNNCYKGYIVECDLHFPPELHDKFKE